MVAALSLVALGACAALRTDRDPESVVRQKFVAFDRHDADDIEGLYGPEAILQSPDYPRLQGNAPIADTYRRLFKSIPDATDEVQSLDVSGEKVFAQFTLTGHWLGAADKPVKVPILSVYTVRAGRIVADSTYYDRKAP